jgi:hypothetical protein
MGPGGVPPMVYLYVFWVNKEVNIALIEDKIENHN